jgi:hypothetical protein
MFQPNTAPPRFDLRGEGGPLGVEVCPIFRGMILSYKKRKGSHRRYAIVRERNWSGRLLEGLCFMALYALACATRDGSKGAVKVRALLRVSMSFLASETSCVARAWLFRGLNLRSVVGWKAS